MGKNGKPQFSKKNFQKMLDIPEQVCYNKYVIKRDYKIHKKEVMKNENLCCNLF